MPKIIKLRRGTTDEHAGFVGSAGEITVDTTKNTAVIHDGTTAGGHPLAKENHSHDVYAAEEHAHSEYAQSAHSHEIEDLSEQCVTAIAGLCAPSSTFIALPATTTSYTAPAAGYVAAYGAATAGGWIEVYNSTAHIGSGRIVTYTATLRYNAFVPVAPGDSITIESGGITNLSIRFIYAQGAI
ncbi:MAG: hypothetical protein LBT92_01620 [Rickettsiales bacterium]|jgi:hypothetical protein|nr:hypothetical protein [Rickettsiales bacterium]